MSNTNATPEVIEQLLDRLSTASERLAKAAEDQSRQIERRTKELLDQAEAATERLVKALDRELRAQIATVRRDLEQALTRSSGAKKTAAKKAPAKKTPAKKAPAKKAPAKKAPAKKRHPPRRHPPRRHPPRRPQRRRPTRRLNDRGAHRQGSAMRTLRAVVVSTLLVGVALTVVPAGPASGAVGEGHPRLRIDVVVSGGGGSPTGPLQVRRECAPAGNATSEDSDPFTTSTTDLMTGTGSFLGSGQSCVVSVIEAGGMTASFGCATTNAALIKCDSDDTVTWVKDDPPVDASTTTTPPAVEVAPTFTG